MENFTLELPTKLHFGKDVVNDLAEAIDEYGKKVLLVYGKGSIKRNGAYDDVVNQLKKINASVTEYYGIKSNPVFEDADKAAEAGRKNNVDIILAVGGGSVIDTAKAIAVTIPVNHSSWDFYKKKETPKKAIPLIDVLTLAATGTETNMFSVMQNDKTKSKISIITPLIFPQHAFLDPKYTISVPANYTAYGIVDLMAHSLEIFFGKTESSLSDRFAISILQEATEYGPKLMNNLNSYELRARIMLASTMALNGITTIGKGKGDWGAHAIGHVLSVLYDIPHGASLSITYPAWMKFHSDKAASRIIKLGQHLFNTNDIGETIEQFEKFFKSLGSPVKLEEMNITSNKKEEIINCLIKNRSKGFYYDFTGKDYKELIGMMF